MTQERLSRRQFFARSAAVIGTGVLVSELLAACGGVKGEAKSGNNNALTTPTTPKPEAPTATATATLPDFPRVATVKQLETPIIEAVRSFQLISDAQIETIRKSVSDRKTDTSNLRGVNSEIREIVANFEAALVYGVNVGNFQIAYGALSDTVARAIEKLYCQKPDIALERAWLSIRDFVKTDIEKRAGTPPFNYPNPWGTFRGSFVVRDPSCPLSKYNTLP